jgi:predicted NBD/HSP70 family sugar kinase
MTPGEIKGRGHPGMDVILNADSALSLGVHIDRRTLTAVACNLQGHVMWSQTAPLADASLANAQITAAVATFRAAFPGHAARILGLGIAAPGPFGPTTVDAGDAAGFPEIGMDANIQALTQTTGLPIILENDATAAAVGEWLYGAGKGQTNLAVLHFGIGLGAGFILGGSPYRGTQSNAGEIGHMVVQPGGIPCFCGNRGCLERYLSFGALCDALGLHPNDPGAIATITARHAAGDVALTRWITGAAPWFRQAINVIEVMLDPEAVIIGGTVPVFLLDRIIAAATPLLNPISSHAQTTARVIRGATGPLTVAMGAAAVSTNAHFAPSMSRLLL